MLKFEWNALRAGDEVLVHDPADAELTLRPGVVALVYTRRRLNGVGIRMAAEGGAVIAWPTHLAVHQAPRDPRVPCWRCDSLPAATVPSRRSA